MFLLNLTAGEFLTLLSTLGAVITALYLLDRTKRKKVVSSLRFWVPATIADEQQSRRRMREPWSLVLQLLSLLLLLLAIAQLQWGTHARPGRDHVLLLDTSSWAEAKSGSHTVLDLEKTIAGEYFARLAPRDCVMLVRVDGLATPVTSFTSKRTELWNALNQSSAGFSALNIEQALSFARQAQSWSGGRQGEIVYIGPKLIAGSDAASQGAPNLRQIPVPFDRDNCGIRRMGVKRSEEDASSWQATITLKNYGSARHTVRLRTQFAGTAFAPRVVTLQPGEETGVQYNFSSNTSGRLIAEISPGGTLASDDRAVLELPRTGLLRVAVYTNRRELLMPLLQANHRLAVKFFSPADYTPKPPADVMLLDRMAPPTEPQLPTLSVEPPRDRSPLPVKTTVHGAVIKSWHSDPVLAAGLRAKAAGISVAEVFETFDLDVPVAAVSEGPVIVARPNTANRPKLVVIGFDPLNGQLRFEVTTPLLFANLLRWLSPEAFRTVDVTAGRVGVATVALDRSERPDRLRVIDQLGSAVPFTVRQDTLQLFASRPGIIRLISDDRERVLSLTLPDVAEFEWKPGAAAASGLPPQARLTSGATDLWQSLALLAGIALFIEWMLFARRGLSFRPARAAGPRHKVPAAGSRQTRPERKQELAAK